MKGVEREVVLVSPESPWPTRHGGRRRTAQLAHALASQLNVTVVHPARPDDERIDDQRLRTLPVESPPPGRLAGRLSGPRLGEVFAAPVLPVVRQLITAGAGAVVWSHSYLAATGMNRVHAPMNVVDFANIEGERFRSLAAHGASVRSRCSPLLEWLKAEKWEPRVAVEADLSLAITEHDYRWLTQQGARAILARNGLDPVGPLKPSPANGAVLAVGNWDYAPNRDGMASFIRHTWPAVRCAVAWARLEVAGAGGDHFANAANDMSVTALGFVPDLAPVYANAAVVLAPAQSGGGSQLKVAEAWGHGRVVIGPLHLRQEMRRGLPDGALISSANLGGVVARVLGDVTFRHNVERELALYVRQHTWQYELSEAVAEVVRLLGGGSLTAGAVR